MQVLVQEQTWAPQRVVRRCVRVFMIILSLWFYQLFWAQGLGLGAGEYSETLCLHVSHNSVLSCVCVYTHIHVCVCTHTCMYVCARAYPKGSESRNSP